ncbi:MAG: DUF3313 domain-containing protein [Verrucomicrobiota bacterium]
MKSIHQFGVIAMAGVALAVVSCSTGGSSPSGFLAHFSQLDAGYGTEDAVCAYVKPGVDLKKYDSVVIDPVTTVVATPGITPEVTSQLAAYLSDAMRTAVAGKMKIVTVPGPTTLRVRVALTDVIAKTHAGTPVTTMHTSPRVALTGNLGSAAVAAFISNVSFEGEFVDSVTGERFTALCDHRLGAKRLATAATPWAAVRTSADHGAARLCQRIMKLRGQ